MPGWGWWMVPVEVVIGASVAVALIAFAASRIDKGGPAWRPWAMAASAVAAVWLLPLVWFIPREPMAILPPWPALPFYAVLRAVPHKEVGLALAFALPGIMGAALWLPNRAGTQFRSLPGTAALAGLGLAWLLLFFGGMQLPDMPVFGDGPGGFDGLNNWLTLTRAAALYVYAYLLWFLLWPRPAAKASV